MDAVTAFFTVLSKPERMTLSDIEQEVKRITGGNVRCTQMGPKISMEVSVKKGFKLLIKNYLRVCDYF